MDSCPNRLIERMLAENQRTTRAYFESVRARGLSARRIYRQAETLAQLDGWLKKPFEQATREDLQRIAAGKVQGKYSPWSRHTILAGWKVFWKWLKKTEYGHPPEVAWIHAKPKPHELKEGPRISFQESAKLLEKAKNPADMALLAILRESGFRPGEILNLKVSDVSFIHDGRITVLPAIGKTGPRKRMLAYATPYLRKWLAAHPLRDTPNAPLFPVRWNGRWKTLSYNGLRKKLQKYGKLTFYHFRRGFTDFILDDCAVSESQADAIMGWVVGSGTSRIYKKRAAGNEGNEKVLETLGFTLPKKENALKTPFIHCPNCTEENPSDRETCLKCAWPLTQEGAEKWKLAREITNEVLTRLSKKMK